MSSITAKQWKSNYQKVMKNQYHYKNLSNELKRERLIEYHQSGCQSKINFVFLINTRNRKV